MAKSWSTIQRSLELERLTKRFYEVLAVGDGEAIADLWSDDDCVLTIGTDDEEWDETKAAIVANIQTQIDEADGDSYAIGIEPGRLRAWEEGTVGWMQDNPTFVTPSGKVFKCRHTAVFRLEGTRWKVVQSHLSVGSPNLEVWGKEYTTGIGRLAEAVSVERPDLSQASNLDGIVTIAFTDIESSTEIAARVGDHEWIEILRRHHGVVQGATASAGGQVVKSQGDGFMLAFPRASGALDCATAIQEATQEPRLDESLKIRIGINSGEVVRQIDDFFGRSVNIAARLADRAQGGETLVSGTVAALVAGDTRFLFSQPTLVDLKGLSEPVEVRQLLSTIGGSA
jgi:class 3 adenylate cyclase